MTGMFGVHVEKILMKTLSSVAPTVRRILLAITACAMAASGDAQVHSTPVKIQPALGLSRLNAGVTPDSSTLLDPVKFSIVDLAAIASLGTSKGKQNGVDYLALAPAAVWTRTLRGANGVLFASFQVLASQSTVIEIGGARLGVTAGPISDSLQLMYDDSSTASLQWKALNVHFGAGAYDGKPMAALPVLTVQIDPAEGVWHLYAGSRLLADHLPLIAANKSSRQFTVTAGKDGAWITGLVLADENPLIVDSNFNSIDDAFEKQQRGTLLPATASLLERRMLAQQWRDYQRAHPPSPLVVSRPLPDAR